MSDILNGKIARLQSGLKRTSHVLHLILSILTLGFWAFIWLIVALSNSLENWKINRKIDALIAQAERQQVVVNTVSVNRS